MQISAQYSVSVYLHVNWIIMLIARSLVLALIMVCEFSDEIDFELDFVSRPIETIVSTRQGTTAPVNRIQTENLIYRSPIEVITRPRKQKTADRNTRSIDFSNLVSVETNRTDFSSKLGLVNARSVRNKTGKIVDILTGNKLDILVVTETWLSDNDDHIVSEITPDDYICLRKDRTTGRGGGIAVLCKKAMDPKQLSSNEFQSFEYDILRFHTKSEYLRLIVVYRPPSTSPDLFIDEFSTLLESYLFSTDNTLIVGDFNFPMDKVQDRTVNKFRDMLHMFSLRQHVRDFTHIEGHILDLVISAENDSIISQNVIVEGLISDHFLIVCPLTIRSHETKSKKIKCRKIGDIDLESFRADIKNSKLNTDLTGSLEETVQDYTDILQTLLNKHAPESVKTLKPRPRQPWYKSNLRSIKQISRRKERKLRKTQKSDSAYADIKADFKKAEEYYFKSVDSAKTAYYGALILDNKGDQGKLYRVLNTLMNKKKENPLPNHNSTMDLANTFGQYFLDKIDNIRKSFTDSGNALENDLADEVNSSFTRFQELSDVEIEALIRGSSSKTSCLDPIPTSLVKSCAVELVPVISKIINSSLSTSVFPSSFKQAIVTPLLKKPSLAKIPKNYRPVSNLSFISKLTEKAASSQLDKYIDDYNLADPMQSGYRSGCGTETALVRIFEEILIAMDSKKITFLCLLDNSAAFDTVDYDILLTRLQLSFGVGGSARDWFKSYFTNRSQRVKICDIFSESLEINCGAPQGSIYGPKAYKQYTRPAGKVIGLFDLFHSFYADDGQLLNAARANSHADQKAAVDTIQDAVEALGTWMRRNKLKLNEEKTQFMVLGPKRLTQSCTISSIQLGKESVEKSDFAVNLGVTMDSELNMSEHISSVCRRCYYSLRIISRIRRYLDEDCVKSLVQSLIISRLDYGNVLLYGVSAKDLAKLQRVMNAAARIIAKKRPRDHITPVLKALHWLKIQERIEFKIALLVFKSLRGQGPQYLRDLISVYEPSRNLRSKDSLLLVEPKYKLERCGRRAFSRCGPRVWNSLPYSIRSCQKLEMFKKKLKTFLFQKSYK